MLPLCADQGVAVVPWSPLARGRLARDWSTRTARSADDAYGDSLYAASVEADRKVVARVSEVAARHGVSRAQVALAWLQASVLVALGPVGTATTGCRRSIVTRSGSSATSGGRASRSTSVSLAAERRVGVRRGPTMRESSGDRGVGSMADYERSVGLAAPADRAFQCLADPANMPKYVAMMTTAVPRGGETVHVAAEVQGRHEEGDAHVHADNTRRRLEWGGAGEGGYRGWLEVAESGEGSTVTVHIHAEHDSADDDAVINRAFDETMQRMQALVEEAG